MKKIIIASLILLLVLFTATRISATGDAGILSITKLSTSATQYTTNCYFPIQISTNITWTGSNSFYRINLNDFWLVVTTPNVQVTNSSASSYKNPNNQIRL